jgi:alanyl-tRNA synthetase
VTTTRIYFTDALARDFDAEVVSCVPAPDGRFSIVLDRTAFYPTSGGQPFDTGRLGSARVLDVADDDDGVIHHVTDAALPPGARVMGAIDWARRFDHMQQHTGQHILSAAFDHLHSVRTMSFHLGAESATIDLAREVTPTEISDAEAEANRVVWEDRPITVRFVTEEEAARLPLRKEPVKTGRLRLVEVADFDLSACGGTHVPAAGMIGVIAVSGWERFKGATRLSFVCGGRALRSHGALRDIVTAAARTLTVHPGELATSIERLLAEGKEHGRALKRLESELASYRAVEMRAAATTIGPLRVVLSAQPIADPAVMRTLAQAIVSESGLAVVLVGDGSPAPVVVARSADVGVDAGALLKQMAAELGGRGGGRSELAQGGVTAAPKAILAFARRTLS